MNQKLKLKILPYLLITPGVLFLAIFIAYPTIQSLTNAFFAWNGRLDSKKIFVGFSNFYNLIHDKLFLIAFKNTFIFSLLIVIGTVVTGFILAAFINKKIKGWQFYRFAFFITVALSSVVISLLWFSIYDPINGLLNKFLDLLNLGFLKQSWIGDTRFALLSVSIVAVWQYSGLTMVWLLAGMKTIPPDIYDSARIDGANYVQYILHIIIPMIKQVIFVVIMIMLIACFKLFDIIWVMTKGGPVDSTQVLSSVVYLYLFSFRQIGPASSISIVTLIIGLIFSIFYLRLTYYAEKR